MPIGQAQDMLRQLQQQMMNPNFGQGFMNQLGNAGLGAQNPQQFFGTPLDEQFLRQSVLGRVLGYYGMPNAQSGQYNNIGNPFSLINGQQNIDPFSGGMNQQPDWMAGGFANKGDWKRAGRPELQGGPNPALQVNPDSRGGGGQMGIMPFTGNNQADISLDGITGGGFMAPQGGNQFYDMMQGYNPNVSALNNNYPQMFADALQRVQTNSGGFGGGATGGPFFPPGFNPNQQGTPNGIPPQAQNWINQITQGQIGMADADFQLQKEDLTNRLFGRGMQSSSAAADSAGKLLFNRGALMNQLTGQGADRALQLYQQMLELNADKNKGGGGINYFGGAFGGPQNTTDMGNLAMELKAGGSPNSQMNILQGISGGSSPVPLNFEQQMQLAEMQLRQQQLQQQGQLGFGGLGLQQQLGLGSQGLQGQGLAQDFMSQLMQQGLARQQGAAGFNQSDMARMQQYLTNQSNQFANIGQQNAQLEAQRRSFMSQLMGGLMGGLSAFGGLGGISGLSSLFGGGGASGNSLGGGFGYGG